ncbi:MAG: SIMPL domain-containing protein, partial [Nocardioides sp.]
MSVRTLGVGALVVLALLVAYLLGNAGGSAQATPGAPAPTAPTAPAAERPRTLTLSGVGQVNAVPDELGFTLRVGQTRADLRTALRDTNATIGRVLASLAGHGVAKKDVQTTGLAMFPVYDYHSEGPPTLRGYR